MRGRDLYRFPNFPALCVFQHFDDPLAFFSSTSRLSSASILRCLNFANIPLARVGSTTRNIFLARTDRAILVILVVVGRHYDFIPYIRRIILFYFARVRDIAYRGRVMKSMNF